MLRFVRVVRAAAHAAPGGRATTERIAPDLPPRRKCASRGPRGHRPRDGSSAYLRSGTDARALGASSTAQPAPPGARGPRARHPREPSDGLERPRDALLHIDADAAPKSTHHATVSSTRGPDLRREPHRGHSGTITPTGVRRAAQRRERGNALVTLALRRGVDPGFRDRRAKRPAPGGPARGCRGAQCVTRGVTESDWYRMFTLRCDSPKKRVNRVTAGPRRRHGDGARWCGRQGGACQQIPEQHADPRPAFRHS